jgi:hypothetical protein
LRDERWSRARGYAVAGLMGEAVCGSVVRSGATFSTAGELSTELCTGLPMGAGEGETSAHGGKPAQPPRLLCPLHRAQSGGPLGGAIRP